jgi:hypothetical protein
MKKIQPLLVQLIKGYDFHSPSLIKGGRNSSWAKANVLKGEFFFFEIYECVSPKIND